MPIPRLKELPLFDPLDQIQKDAHGSRKHLRLVAGEELKEEGMRAVLDATPEPYKLRIQHALLSFPLFHRITVEDLTHIAGRPPEGTHFNAVGAIINGLAKRGFIRKTGRMVKAQRPGMHATELAEWEVLKWT